MSRTPRNATSVHASPGMIAVHLPCTSACHRPTLRQETHECHRGGNQQVDNQDKRSDRKNGEGKDQELPGRQADRPAQYSRQRRLDNDVIRPAEGRFASAQKYHVTGNCDGRKEREESRFQCKGLSHVSFAATRIKCATVSSLMSGVVHDVLSDRRRC